MYKLCNDRIDQNLLLYSDVISNGQEDEHYKYYWAQDDENYGQHISFFSSNIIVIAFTINNTIL